MGKTEERLDYKIAMYDKITGKEFYFIVTAADSSKQSNTQKERATNGNKLLITSKMFDAGSNLTKTNGGKYE